jgi:CRP-like cAMP-binding protein
VEEVTLAEDLSPFARRLARTSRLSRAEISVVNDLQLNTRKVRRSNDITTEGRSEGTFFIMMEGNGIRYRTLRDGRRQIVNLVFPGDIVGITGSVLENSMFPKCKALTDVVVSVVPFAKITRLYETDPQLITKIFWLFSYDSAMYAEHLVDLGRRTSLERVAHFFLEVLTRLEAVGIAEQQSYVIPLTQKLIADVLGLTVSHVNRVLRQLREDGLAVLENQRVTIKNSRALGDLAEFDPSYLSRVSGIELLGPAL